MSEIKTEETTATKTPEETVDDLTPEETMDTKTQEEAVDDLTAEETTDTKTPEETTDIQTEEAPVVAKAPTVQVEAVMPPVQEEEIIDYSDLDELDAPKHQSFQPTLDWLIDDFDGITENVYEAAMICARRARQVGREQKMDIDKWNTTHDITEPGVLPDENAEQGVDHFHHPKPTVQSMHELKTQVLEFSYLDSEGK